MLNFYQIKNNETGKTTNIHLILANRFRKENKQLHLMNQSEVESNAKPGRGRRGVWQG